MEIKNWKWKLGMTLVLEDSKVHLTPNSMWISKRKDVHPDWEDPGTIGHVIFLIQELWGPDFSMVFNLEGMVEIIHIPTANVAFYKSGPLKDCLIEAIESAPT